MLFRSVILPLPKAASFSFPLPKLLVTTSWGGWSQGWRRGEGQTQEQARLCPVTMADAPAERLLPSSWRPSCARTGRGPGSALPSKLPWLPLPQSSVSDQSLGQADPLEKGMATQSSILAWRIPGTGKPGGLPSMGSHRVGHD